MIELIVGLCALTVLLILGYAMYLWGYSQGLDDGTIKGEINERSRWIHEAWRLKEEDERGKA